MVMEGEEDVQHAKQQVQVPPPSSSSPSHEFSFTISLHPSAAKLPPAPPLSAAIDLSPADEIFFHGHLLPLHLLSHLPVVSPRSSTNSLDSFTLPIKDLLHDHHSSSSNNNNNKSSYTSSSEDYCTTTDHHRRRHVVEEKERGKSKPFSLFGIPKWRTSKDDHQEKDHQTHEKRSSKSSKLELFKRYMRLVKPFLSLRSKRGSSGEFLRQPGFSYSGNLRLRPKKKEVVRGRRGEFSAPVSMRTSPTNSGLLMAASGTVTPTSASDSTMEELQAAIQAAIAHCKKSIATEDTIKVP